jgi:hypothetical protein
LATDRRQVYQIELEVGMQWVLLHNLMAFTVSSLDIIVEAIGIVVEGNQ